VTRRALHRRILAHRIRRYHIGPYSYLERLKVAALGDHVCQRFPVRLDQGA
jgi:hypothetical protein